LLQPILIDARDPLLAGSRSGDHAYRRLGGRRDERGRHVDLAEGPHNRVRSLSRRAEAAIERRGTRVGERQHAGKGDFDSERFTEIPPGGSPKRFLAENHAGRIDAVAADVHQRAAGERLLQAHVRRIEGFELERERRANGTHVTDFACIANLSRARAAGESDT